MNEPYERLYKHMKCAYSSCFYWNKYKEELKHIDSETFFKLKEYIKGE